MHPWTTLAQITGTIAAQVTPTPEPVAAASGGISLDVWTVVSAVALFVGLAAGVVQVVDYVQKMREKRQARTVQENTAQTPVAQVISPPPVPEPAIAEPGSPPSNLPAQQTPFIGRERERAALGELLLREDARLLTLTGPGGTGKTRLALQVAEEVLAQFEDGVWFVPLAPISDPDLVISEIAQTLEVKEAEGKPLLQTIKMHLRDKKLVLVMDNFEQVMGATPLLGQLLDSAPRLKMIVTSRELLRLTSEHEFEVPPMEVPDLRRLPRLEALSRYETVTLFVQRAQSAKPYFTLTNDNAVAIVEICARLDGLPLAIELAAARVKMLTPQAILERLSSRLQLLTTGARDLPARQQTLRNAIDWSHTLLEKDEQALFRRLAVFVGGWTLEAAESVCANVGLESEAGDNPKSKIGVPTGPLKLDVLDGMTSLVEKSLLRREAAVGDEQRFSMLETIREYALERLEASGESGPVHEQHAQYYLSLAEQAEPKLRGREQEMWQDRLEVDHDNMRAVLARLEDAPEGDAASKETGLRLAAVLGLFWQLRGYVSEGRERLNNVLQLAPGESAEHTAVRAKALAAAARLAFVQSDYATARAMHAESLEIWRELDQKQGIASSLNGLGHVAAQQGDYESAAAFYEESLEIWRELDDKSNIAISLNNLAIVVTRQGDYEHAKSLLEENLTRMREFGDKRGEAASLNNLGNVAFSQGDFEDAWGMFEESLTLERELGSKQGIGRALGNLAKIALRQANYDRAREMFEESLALRTEVGDKLGISKCLAGLANIICAKGEPERAAKLLGAADALLVVTGTKLDPTDLAEYERYVDSVRSQLDVKKYEEEWEAGRAMTAEQAAAQAKT